MKLIASDIDGTILDHEGLISARTVQAFRAAEAAGIEVVFVTGRPPRWLDPLRRQVGHLGRVICSNGALVYDLAGESVVSTKCLSVGDVLAAKAAIRQVAPGASFAAETIDGLFLEPEFLHEESSPALLQLTPAPLEDSLQEENGHRVLKFLARMDHHDADAFLAVVRPVVARWADATHSAPGMALLELSRVGVNKAATLSEYAASRHIDATEVIAFGDMPNDVEMLSWAGRGYAMASGHPAAQAATALRAPALAEDGVAQVLEELLGALTT
ncbi:HAD family hydrolase [Psychromicrobium xiongbiense]|uniref:HAD family hydrolase n=1 Tax=Psychromicrobium xiongbiense TaxID=3051184 RepID=UPI0025568975|nr:HAD family hydrolase [Psychromicrobium sp. YIM S02556]